MGRERMPTVTPLIMCVSTRICTNVHVCVYVQHMYCVCMRVCEHFVCVRARACIRICHVHLKRYMHMGTALPARSVCVGFRLQAPVGVCTHWNTLPLEPLPTTFCCCSSDRSVCGQEGTQRRSARAADAAVSAAGETHNVPPRTPRARAGAGAHHFKLDTRWLAPRIRRGHRRLRRLGPRLGLGLGLGLRIGRLRRRRVRRRRLSGLPGRSRWLLLLVGRPRAGWRAAARRRGGIRRRHYLGCRLGRARLVHARRHAPPHYRRAATRGPPASSGPTPTTPSVLN